MNTCIPCPSCGLPLDFDPDTSANEGMLFCGRGECESVTANDGVLIRGVTVEDFKGDKVESLNETIQEAINELKANVEQAAEDN